MPNYKSAVIPGVASIATIQSSVDKLDDPYIRYLNSRELCKILNKSEPTLYRLRRARAIPYVRIGGEIRFRLRDVERALERYTVKEISL